MPAELKVSQFEGSLLSQRLGVEEEGQSGAEQALLQEDDADATPEPTYITLLFPRGFNQPNLGITPSCSAPCCTIQPLPWHPHGATVTRTKERAIHLTTTPQKAGSTQPYHFPGLAYRPPPSRKKFLFLRRKTNRRKPFISRSSKRLRNHSFSFLHIYT